MSDAPAAAAAPAAPKKSLLIPILLVVNSLLVVGGVGFVVKTMSGASHPAKEGEAEAAPAKEGEKKEGGEGGEKKEGEGAATHGGMGPTVKLPDFVVRLRNPEADRYARITFEVELVSETDRDKLTPMLPRIRDAFIALMSDMTVEELRGSEGLDRLKTALLKKLEEIMPSRAVRNLYVSDFIVQ
jgi:flagellar FliL protein